MTPSSVLPGDPRIVFEPWHLGDAVIAARGAREAGAVLQIHPRWSPVLRALYPGLETRTIDAPYIRKGQGRMPLDDYLNSLPREPEFRGTVVSIRGDFRDRKVAKTLYPAAALKFSGTAAFVARHVWLADLPFKLGILRVRNRYERWAAALGLPAPSFTATAPSALARSVLIHMGAQWLSKRYPWPKELRDLLVARKLRVTLAVGPSDPPLAGLPEVDVVRLEGASLVQEIRNCDLTVCNDSAPMHIASALGRPIVVLSAFSNLAEWIPPGPVLSVSRMPPSGYHVGIDYMADSEIVDEARWDRPSQVLERMIARKWIE